MISEGGDPAQPYPDGWFWAAELMNRKYVAAPNMFRPGSTSFEPVIGAT